MDERDLLVGAADFFPVLDLAREDADDLVFREALHLVLFVDDEDERLDDDFVVDEAFVLVLVRQVDVGVADVDGAFADLVHARERAAAGDVDRDVFIFFLECFLRRLQERQQSRRARGADLAADLRVAGAGRRCLLLRSAAAGEERCADREGTEGHDDFSFLEHVWKTSHCYETIESSCFCGLS